jgi:hypothetical protein
LPSLWRNQSSVDWNPDVRDHALANIDAGADLAVWVGQNPKLLPKRRAALERARAQLAGPQPARRRVRPPKRSPAWSLETFALALPRRVALLRVVRVHADRLGETPVLEELDFNGSDVPTRDGLERLGPRVKDPIFMHAVSPDRRLTAFVNQRTDWQHAVFQKIQTFWGSPRRRARGAAKHWHLVGRARRRLPSSSGAVVHHFLNRFLEAFILFARLASPTNASIQELISGSESGSAT